MLELLPGYLLIFSARVVDVSCATLRMLFVVRGKKFYGAMIGFVEVIVYVLALDYVVSRLNDPKALIIYALGFATGNIVGSTLEEKLAVGIVTVQVITMAHPLELTQILRSAGFGVTVWEGQGREGIRHVLNIIVPRKRMQELMSIVNNWDYHAFITVFDTRATKGGIIMRKAK